MTYNRSILLKYACEAILNSNELEPQFPPKLGNGIIYSSVIPKSKSQFSSTAIKLLDSYCHMLNYVTLPLLEDLWDILTDKDILKISLDFDCYYSFIKEHNKFITSDYTLLDLNALQDKNIPESKNFSKYYNQWERTFKSSGNHKDMIYLTNPIKENLQYLLKYYCQNPHAIHLNKQLITTLVESQSYEPGLFQRKLYDKETKLFRESHINSIYEFCNTLQENDPAKKSLGYLVFITVKLLPFSILFFYWVIFSA